MKRRALAGTRKNIGRFRKVPTTCSCKFGHPQPKKIEDLASRRLVQTHTTSHARKLTSGTMMSDGDPRDVIQALAERAAHALVAHAEIDTGGLLGELAIAARSAMIALDMADERAAERAAGKEFLVHVDLCLRYRNEDPRISQRLRELRLKIDRAYPVLQ
jgi:hypothetical protein